MRSLNKLQKKILSYFDTTTDIDQLPKDVWEDLQRANDYETLWSDCNRFLRDQHTKKLYGR